MELSERNLKQLEDEGYATVYEVFDEPNTSYPVHAHETNHAIIITEGSMSVTIGDETKTYATGERINILASTEHSVTIGSEGCKYVIGE